MLFKYLGTAAAEGFPALFCMCDTCLKTKQSGGRNIRSRAQAILDNKIVFDFGPDSYYHMLKFDVPYEKVHHVLLTHTHSDHFYMPDLIYRRPGYASKVEKMPLYVYSHEIGYNRLMKSTEEEQMIDYVKPVHIEPYSPFMIEDYEIVALDATHDINAGPYIYLVKKDNKYILYAHDTGDFPEKTWDYLKTINHPLDFVSLDCTAGLLKNWNYSGHLSFETLLKVKEKMTINNIINEKTIFVANHFSHNGHGTYDEMLEVGKENNVIISYDGLEINI